MSSTDEYDTPRRNIPKRGNLRKDDHSYKKKQDMYPLAPYPVSEPSPNSRNFGVIDRPNYQGSDLSSVEEIRREFSPPGAGFYYKSRDDWETTFKRHPRASSTERNKLHGDFETDKNSNLSNKYPNEANERKETHTLMLPKSRSRSLSRNEIIFAAVSGAALAVGGKELWDRRKSEKRPVQSNTLETVAIGAAGAFAAYEGVELYSKHVEKEKFNHSSNQKLGADQFENLNNDKKKRIRSKRSMSHHRSSVKDISDSSDSSNFQRNSRGRRNTRKREGNDRHHSRSREKSLDGAAQLQQAAKTALLAGATEAFRVRNEPGGWAGDKGRRVLTAAIGASAIDAVADGKGKRHILEAVIGGLASNRLINGSRHQEDDNRSIISKYNSRSRSRSRGRDGAGSLAAIVSAGIGALASKKLLDQPRSRSRASTSQRRRVSPNSYRGHSPSNRRDDSKPRHERGKSVAEIARKGLVALGLGETSDHERDKDKSQHRSHRYESESDYSSGRSRYKASRNLSADSTRKSSRYTQRKSNVNRSQHAKNGIYNTSDSEDIFESSKNDEKRMKRSKEKYYAGKTVS